LLKKLAAHGIAGKVLKWIEDWLSNRKQQGSADVHIGHRKSVTSEPAGTSANWRRQVADVADVDVVKNSSAVTTTELSPPPQWLATIERYSVLGGLSVCCFLKTAPRYPADLRVI